MTQELLLALIVFATVSSVTPGPNNLMLMASGTNYGFRRTIPHMLGVSIGFMVMLVLVGLGIAQVFDRVPYSYTVLKVVSVVYLLWLAWKIATATAPEGDVKVTGKPFTFLQAAAFQWVNPKAWAMALTSMSVYMPPERPLYAVFVVAGVFAMINFPNVSLWALLGTQLRRFLSSPLRLRVFNWTAALLLVASLYPIVIG